MGVLDRVRTRARRMASGTATAGRDIVKAPSRLIRSMQSGDGGDDAAVKQKPAVSATEAPPGDGILGRARANPWLTVAIAAGSLLAVGWIAWAVYVTSENGATAGLGVVIAWPAMLTGLVLVALPFIGLGLMIRRLGSDDGEPSAGTDEADEPEEAEAEEEDESVDEEADAEGAEAEEAEDSEETEEVASG
jgi:hypothetical protein